METQKTFHKNIFIGIENALRVIFTENKYADKVIEKLLKSNRQWGSRDRKLIAESVYEIVRWKRRLEFAANISPNNPLYFWHLIGCHLAQKEDMIPYWPEFKDLDLKQCVKRYNSENVDFAIKESIPDWMNEIGLSLLPNIWEKEIKAMNLTASVVLRVNTLKISVSELQKIFAKNNIACENVTNIPNALVLQKRINVFTLPEFHEGLFEIQDGGSQLIAPFLDIKEGMRVVDACAGAGGKSLHIASILKNSGKIISLDTEAWKLDELKKRAKRGGISNIETHHIDNSKVIKRLYNTADRLLLDVPCSGIGVLKRNPDAKWKINPKFIEEVQIKQASILSEYAPIVKPGGMLVYATCSILPIENEKQVQQFLEKNIDYQLVKQQHIYPSEGYDGYYMSLILRNK
ncbi:MAG: methyltransferase domain-containing protein [Bacteroidota bacterium]|nr:methyltransferase domain-containing protein [Bacteroidota bacterium]